MLIHTGFGEALGNAYTALSHFPGIPIHYNTIRQCFEFRKTFANAATAIYLGIMATIMCADCLLSTSDKSPLWKFIELFWTCAFAMAAHFNWVFFSEPRTTIAMFNSFVGMEKRMARVGYTYTPDRQTKMAKTACSFLMRPIVLSTILWGVGSIFLPCQPINFFSIFMSQGFCNNSPIQTNFAITLFKFAVKTVLAIINGLTFYAAATSGICCAVQIIVGVMCIRYNIKVFGKLAESPEIRIHTVIGYYREIQILTGIFNSIHRSVLLHLLEAISLSQIFLGFISIRCGISLGAGLPIPIFLLLVCSILALQSVVVILVIYGLGSEAHTCSRKALQHVNSVRGFTRKAVGRRFIASCPCLKVDIGTRNFVEKDTSLNMVNFCTARIVDLLLLQ
ncbi:unnamed protein product [Orchesella dallaii]|uniref:Odorant receptor n=1 Tax=Orchesella dallaii TaxID=48710 RepID=A0ABP1RZX6_9HEXA